jgi:hypothetical protein
MVSLQIAVAVTIIASAIFLHFRSKHDAAYKVSQTIHDWKIERITNVPDLDINAIYLTHKSGARYLHLNNTDTNKFFSVTFRTPCSDDSGLPHILEHLVLCGSKKYPVRDPFFSMIKRSLNTFMNAWTAAEHTSYPFSTQNDVDFFNLLDIYLDATFHPLLRESDFMQEGWRVESSNGTNEIKGVVYNEMKGVMGNANSFLNYAINRHLFPNTPYAYNNGGDPPSVPKLSYQTLLEYHKKHYSAKNAFFYTYGNINFEKVLETLQVEGGEDLSWGWDVKLPEKRVHVQGPPDSIALDPEKQTRMVVGILVPKLASYYDYLVYGVCSRLLLDTSGPLYQALIESGLAPSLVPGSGFEEMDLIRYQPSFIVGVSGIAESDVEKVWYDVLLLTSRSNE